MPHPRAHNAMKYDDIDLALERIGQQWRATLHRQPLITELTALDWQAHTLDEQPRSDELISKISRLRSQIWLSSEKLTSNTRRPRYPIDPPGSQQGRAELRT